MPKALCLWSRPSSCKACSTHEVLSCTLPPKQKRLFFLNQQLTLDLPHPGNLTQMSPPTHHPANPILPPSNTPTDPKTSPDFPQPRLPHLPTPLSPFPSTLHCQTGHASNTLFPLREVADPEGPTRVHVPALIWDMSQIAVLGSFQKILPDTEKNSLRLSQAL